VDELFDKFGNPIMEMARIGDSGAYSFWVYSETQKQRSFHFKHKSDFEVVINADDFTVLEIKNNKSKYVFTKNQSLPSNLQKIVDVFFKSPSRADIEINNWRAFNILWSSLNG
jgi:hypothetical protein